MQKSRLALALANTTSSCTASATQECPPSDMSLCQQTSQVCASRPITEASRPMMIFSDLDMFISHDWSKGRLFNECTNRFAYHFLFCRCGSLPRFHKRAPGQCKELKHVTCNGHELCSSFIFSMYGIICSRTSSRVYPGSTLSKN